MEYMEQAIIVDVDGTLAHRVDRSPHDYNKVHTDAYDSIIGDIVTSCSDIMGLNIIIMTGRPESAKADTVRWLYDNGLHFDAIFTRADGDYREDSLVKYDLYKEHIEPFYEVQFVLDDRNQVVKMWRDEGLKVLQVAEGDF